MKRTRRNGIPRLFMVYVIGFMLAIVSAAPALGQFIVQPMQLEIAAAPGEWVRTEVELQNHDLEETVVVSLRVVDLSQIEDGSWRVVEPNASDIDRAKLQSCKEWIKLNSDSYSVKPMTIEPVRLSLRVQGGVRGIYSAAILVRLGEVTEETDVGLIIQFVIPVLVHVQGRAPLRKVEMTDLNLEFQEATANASATTLVSMNVSNIGGTYSRLRGLLSVWGYFGDHWRLFSEREIQVPGILPGSNLKLVGDIGRSLPSGRYRIAGAVLVDGRRGGSVQKEVDFAGDPSITKIAADVALNVEPKEIIINALPESTRNSVIQVSNNSDEAVDVRVALALPAVLRGVAFGPSYKGEDLNCVEWLEVVPKSFRLPRYGRQNIQIIAKVKNSEMEHPCYYAILGLNATYPDGQDAGWTTAHVCVVNQRCEGDDAKPTVRAAGPISIGLQKGSEYIASIVLGNHGKMHFTPGRCRALVTNANGLSMSGQVRLDSEKPGIMLPFEFRAFSGLIDFSEYPAGLYRIEISLEYGSKGLFSTQLGLEVTLDGEQRVVKTLQQGEYERRVGVQWR